MRWQGRTFVVLHVWLGSRGEESLDSFHIVLHGREVERPEGRGEEEEKKVVMRHGGASVGADNRAWPPRP